MPKRINSLLSILLPLALLCFASNSAEAQCTSPFPNIEFVVPDTTVAEGANFCIDVRVNNFQEIYFWIAPISFNPNVLRLTSCSIDKDVEYNHPDIGVTFVCDIRYPLDVNGDPANPPPQPVIDNVNNQIASGFFNYSSAFFQDFEIADGGRFITLCFEVIGAVGDQTKIDVGDIPPFGGVNGTSLEIFNIEAGGTNICIDPVQGGNITVGCVSPTASEPTTCPTNPGVDTGNIRFTICGGTPPYQYSLNGGPSVTVNNSLDEVVINDLAAGDYNIDITDNSGTPILVSNPITVGSGTPLIIDDVLTRGPTCPSVTNLNSTFINVVTSGGSGGDLTYQWSSTGVSVNPLEKINVGNYAVTVIDNNGCKAIEENIVVDYNPLEMSIDVVEPFCATDPAVVTISVEGGQQDGSGRYAFFTRSSPTSTIDIPLPRRASPFTPDNVNVGQVYFRAEDYSLSDPQCSVDTILTINALQNVTLELLPSNDGCGSGGTIEVNARLEGGSTPLSNNLNYRLFDEDGIEVDLISSSNTFEIFTGLPVGDYIVELSDEDNGCIYLEDETVPPNTGAGLMVTPIPSNPGCGQQGMITIDVTGDPSNYSFLWEDGTLVNGDNIRPNLDAGNYFVTVTELSTGCAGETGEIQLRDAGSSIDFNDNGEIRFVPSPVPCNGVPSGALTVSLRDPDLRAAANYTWYRDGIVLTGENSEDLLGLSPGDYTVEINGNGICTSTMTYTIAEPTRIDLDIIQEEIVCFGDPTANFRAVDLNGSTGFEITWQDTFNESSLPEDVLQQSAPNSTYFVSVSDPVTGCTDDTIFVVEEYPEFTIDFSTIDNVCFADMDGEVIANVSGGSGDGAINYTWSTDPGNPIPNLNTQQNLSSGPYTLQVFDNRCVSEEVPFEIAGGEEIKVDLMTSIITPPSCFGEKDGTAEINISGGSGIPRLIRFRSPDTLIANGVNPSLLTGIPAGDYSVQIQDDAGCTGSDNLIISQPDSFMVAIDSANIQTLSCNSDNTAILRAIVSGGNTDGQRSFSWSHDPQLNNTIATNLVEGEYTFYATDSRGCQDSVDYDMLAPQPIELDFTTLDSVQCFGDRKFFGNLSPTGGTNTGFRFSLGGSLMDVADSILITPGTYNLEIRDQDGCVLDTAFTILQPPEVVVELGPDVEIELGDSHQLRAEHDPEEDVTMYLWESDENIDCLDCPTITVTPERDAVYGISIMNSDGCSDEDEVTIRVRRTRNVFIPNVINTSISNSNSSFKLFSGQGVERIDYLRIFDRFGNLVHEVQQLPGNELGTAEWDARLNGKLIEAGVYVYVARVLFTDEEILEYKGDITVLH